MENNFFTKIKELGYPNDETLQHISDSLQGSESGVALVAIDEREEDRDVEVRIVGGANVFQGAIFGIARSAGKQILHTAVEYGAVDASLENNDEMIDKFAISYLMSIINEEFGESVIELKEKMDELSEEVAESIPSNLN